MEYAPPSEVVWIPESSFEVLAQLVRWARSDFIARRLACDEVALLLLPAEQSFAFQYRVVLGHCVTVLIVRLLFVTWNSQECGRSACALVECLSYDLSAVIEIISRK